MLKPTVLKFSLRRNFYFTVHILNVFTKSASTLAVPFIISIFSFIIFSKPDQIIDIYPSVIDEVRMESGLGGLLHIGYFIGLYGGFSFLLFRATTTRLAERYSRPALPRGLSRRQYWADALTASVLNAMPSYGIAIGFSKAYSSLKPDFPTVLTAWLLSAILLLLYFLAVRTLYRRVFLKLTQTAASISPRRYPLLLFLIASFFAIAVEMCLTAQVYAPRLFGPMAIVVLFLIGLLFVSAAIAPLSRKSGRTVVIIAAISFVVSNYFDLNDNHEMRWSLRDPTDTYTPPR